MFSVPESVGTSVLSQQHQHFPPESEDGAVEYKRMVCTCTPQRLQQLTTQMQYRLREGLGKCTYRVGVDDDGFARGITEDELAVSFGNLCRRIVRYGQVWRLEIIFVRAMQGRRGRKMRS